jgi:CysZ protein
MRGLLFKIIGLTLLVLIALGVILQRLSAYFLHITKWAYVETALEIITGLGLALGLIFLIAPASAIITGLYGEKIAYLTEKKSYPEVKATPMPVMTALFEGIKISLLSLGINFIALLFLFTGIGFLILITANAYLMSREYFEAVAMRHLSPEKAKALRRDNAVKIMLYGLPIGAFMAIPLLNLATPLFGMILFTHVFHGVKK